MATNPIRRLAQSSISGFGLSAGNAAFNTLRRDPGLIAFWGLIAFVVFGFGYAAFAIVRGYNRSWWKTLLVTWGWNLTLGAIYFAVTYFLLLMSIEMVRPLSAKEYAWDATWTFALVTGLIGMVIGLINRIPRSRRFRIERHNLAFLKRSGIRDVGGADETFVDAEGRELNIRDVRKDAIVFAVDGDTARRAYIRLDEKGRMTSYEPA